jgi:hypothetical protein
VFRKYEQEKSMEILKVPRVSEEYLSLGDVNAGVFFRFTYDSTPFFKTHAGYVDLICYGQYSDVDADSLKPVVLLELDISAITPRTLAFIDRK